MRILYVEDNQANVFLVRRVAKMGDHEIINYIDGEEALRKMDSINPDLILMDIQLSGTMTGLDVVRKLRADGYKMPIIAVTAYAMVGDRERCIAAGCSDYLAKPLPIQRLVEIFEQIQRSFTTSERAAVVAQLQDEVSPLAALSARHNSDATATPPATNNTPTEPRKPDTSASVTVTPVNAALVPTTPTSTGEVKAATPAAAESETEPAKKITGEAAKVATGELAKATTGELANAEPPKTEASKPEALVEAIKGEIAKTDASASLPKADNAMSKEVPVAVIAEKAADLTPPNTTPNPEDNIVKSADK